MRILMVSAALAILAVSGPALAEPSSSKAAQRQTTRTTTPPASSVAATKAGSNSAVHGPARLSASRPGKSLSAAGSGGNTPQTSAPLIAAASAASQSNGSTVAIIAGQCDSLTDGDSQGCSFTGNINTNTNGNSSYLLAQNAYNAVFDPNIVLNPLFTVDSSQFLPGGGQFIDNGDGTYRFNLDDSIMLDFFAVKGGNSFTLFEYLGGLDNTYNFTSDNLSHVTFFGTQGVGAVPEPATWAMMLIGFGVIGSSMRRRKAVSSKLLQLA